MGDDNVVDFRRGPHHYRTAGHDWTDSSEQRDALRVPCRYCHATEGEPCKGIGKPLTVFPAHTMRISDAQKGSDDVS